MEPPYLLPFAEFAVRRFSQSWAQVSPFKIIVCSHLTAPNLLKNSTNFPYLETGYSVTMATLGKQTSRRLDFLVLLDVL